MRIGINDPTRNDGSLDRVVENARTAGAPGFGEIGVIDFCAAEFATDPDERAATREMLMSLV